MLKLSTTANFIVLKSPMNEERRKKINKPDQEEQHFPEIGVMLAMAFYYLRQTECDGTVLICPDGQHAKAYDENGGLKKLLSDCGFELKSSIGKTSYGGLYLRENQSLLINPKSGEGDVTTSLKDQGKVHVECKGGIINSAYAGIKSDLTKKMYELVGHAMSQSKKAGVKQVVAMPDTAMTRSTAHRLLPRVTQAGIQIALVDKIGCPIFLKSD